MFGYSNCNWSIIIRIKGCGWNTFDMRCRYSHALKKCYISFFPSVLLESSYYCYSVIGDGQETFHSLHNKDQNKVLEIDYVVAIRNCNLISLWLRKESLPNSAWNVMICYDYLTKCNMTNTCFVHYLASKSFTLHEDININKTDILRER